MRSAPLPARVATHGGMSDETSGMLLGLVGVIIFGLTFPATRLAVADLPPVFVALGRALADSGHESEALEAWSRGIEAARGKGDRQAEKEMTVFARRLARKLESDPPA